MSGAPKLHDVARAVGGQFDGCTGSQSASTGAASGESAPGPAAQSTSAPSMLPVLLTAEQAASMWGIGLTLFAELRASGAEWFPQAVQLSPKVVRYVRAEIEAAARAMPRQIKPSEPAQLRRSRIDTMKRGTGAAA